jgi:hypothetical protein
MMLYAGNVDRRRNLVPQTLSVFGARHGMKGGFLLCMIGVD